MRLDQALVSRGLVTTRSRAQDLVERGYVCVAGIIRTKPGYNVKDAETITLNIANHYVSRGAFKLLPALDCFGFSPQNCICLDAGASTGGFTQVLLERGAIHVYAVDVGHDQIHPLLRGDPRVTSKERVDVRRLKPGIDMPPIDAMTCDVSFISVQKVLPALLSLCAKEAWIVILVKPQFEVGRGNLGKGGIVKNPSASAAAVQAIAEAITKQGWYVKEPMASPVLGQDGNQEFLLGAFRNAITG